MKIEIYTQIELIYMCIRQGKSISSILKKNSVSKTMNSVEYMVAKAANNVHFSLFNLPRYLKQISEWLLKKIFLKHQDFFNFKF